ncbi:MAG: ABC transporter substrate-binding protein [Anaerolineae bacterium]|nr:ABC transporter substrate-binding protein [Anaerolineae bacterium]
MRRSPAFLCTLLILSAAVLLAACGVTPSPQPAQPVEPTPAAGTIAIVDALGREVQFADPPRRIVVAGKSTLTIVNTLYMFPETKERLVALVIGKQPVGDFVRLIDPSFDQKAILDVEAGPEQIAPFMPDVVVLRSFMAEKLGQALEQLSIPLVYVDLETPEQYFRDLATLGRLLGNPARAEEIRAFYQARLDEVDVALQGLDDSLRPRILIVQYTEQGGAAALNAPSASFIQTTEAELAGALPVWKEAAQGGGWTVVNLEQIAAWNPDQIFVIAYQSEPEQVVDKLRTDPGWQGLKAVQDGQVYAFPGDVFSWDQPDPRWILGTTWLAGKAHPDRFPGLEIKEQAARFFEQMYGMDQASVREQILPILKGDVE